VTRLVSGGGVTSGENSPFALRMASRFVRKTVQYLRDGFEFAGFALGLGYSGALREGGGGTASRDDPRCPAAKKSY
jgi:hypothetical protein